MNATGRIGAMPAAEDVLNSWKEIANYLDRGVRTVQRWEAELGLPVRRPSGKSRSAVMALRSDLDEWLRACPVSGREEVAKVAPSEVANQLNPGSAGPLSTRELVARTHILREGLAQIREEFHGTLGRLVQNVQKMSEENPTLALKVAAPNGTSRFKG
jgi:hypothetical protein